MKEDHTILDQIEHEIRRHVFFDSDEKYVANILWIAGTYFLNKKDINIFNAFPMLAFMSPEPDSGKSRALKVTELISCNAISAGKYTTAALLATIDQEPENIRTLCLDEIDTIFSHGKDNSDLIQLFNLGYERDSVIVRLKRFGDGMNQTPAYCPKAFAGLKVARIPGPTKTRTIIIGMRPKIDNERVERFIDKEALVKLRRRIDAWSQTVLEPLKNVDITNVPFLFNRNEQIWEPLLAVAKVTSESWYERAVRAAEIFTAGEHTEKNLSHAILKSTYRIFKTGKYLDRIHSIDLLNELHELGIPKWVETSQLAEYLSGYDVAIKPRQMKISGQNRNGYEWNNFLNSYRTYISKKEEEEVEEDIGLVRKVETVDRVDGRAVSLEQLF